MECYNVCEKLEALSSSSRFSMGVGAQKKLNLRNFYFLLSHNLLFILIYIHTGGNACALYHMNCMSSPDPPKK